ncbi:MAG: MCE family protein, partial [Saprospiraceae bacterium]|nr:MCE family protein [Saprospiraceae bacterium]
MEKQAIDTVKLGLFVLAGLSLLIVSLYILGKNRSMFGAGFEIKAHFRSVNGLVYGNNVRYSGIQIGSVQDVVFLNDTLIEVTMNIEKKMGAIIRHNAVASLGTDGLIGNRVVNIAPGSGQADLIQPGDLLPSKEEINTDEMLQTLRRTNENIAGISEELRNTVHEISSSTQLAALLNDPTLSANIKATLEHLHDASAKAALLMTNANTTLDMASEGKGALATLLRDTSLSFELKQAVQKIQMVENSAEKL